MCTFPFELQMSSISSSTIFVFSIPVIKETLENM